jgi:hypothetical protein
MFKVGDKVRLKFISYFKNSDIYKNNCFEILETPKNDIYLCKNNYFPNSKFYLSDMDIEKYSILDNNLFIL